MSLHWTNRKKKKMRNIKMFPFKVYVETQCGTASYSREFTSEWLAQEFLDIHKEMGFTVVLTEWSSNKTLETVNA